MSYEENLAKYNTAKEHLANALKDIEMARRNITLAISTLGYDTEYKVYLNDLEATQKHLFNALKIWWAKGVEK